MCITELHIPKYILASAIRKSNVYTKQEISEAQCITNIGLGYTPQHSKSPEAIQHPSHVVNVFSTTKP